MISPCCFLTACVWSTFTIPPLGDQVRMDIIPGAVVEGDPFLITCSYRATPTRLVIRRALVGQNMTDGVEVFSSGNLHETIHRSWANRASNSNGTLSVRPSNSSLDRGQYRCDVTYLNTTRESSQIHTLNVYGRYCIVGKVQWRYILAMYMVGTVL